MQFLILLVFNIFIGAVLYLIISLKLERSATEFREKKLRKEMDAIIQEFNLTADRNISILENKIQVLKRLLEKAGEMKTLDVTIGEVEQGDQLSEKSFPIEQSLSGEKVSMGGHEVSNDRPGISSKKTDTFDFSQFISSIKKSLIIFSKGIKNSFHSRDMEIQAREDKGEIEGFSLNQQVSNDESGIAGEGDKYQHVAVENPPETAVEYHEPDISDTAMDMSDEVRPPSGEEIHQMISTADDKYAAVSMLYNKGCSIEDISRYSGIPLGEIKLVLNLSGSR